MQCQCCDYVSPDMDDILETAGDSVDGDVDARHDCCFVYVCAGAVVIVVLSVLSRVSKVCVVVLVPNRLHVLIAVFNACTSPGNDGTRGCSRSGEGLTLAKERAT